MSFYKKINLNPLGVNYDINPLLVGDEQYTSSTNIRFIDNSSEKFNGEVEGAVTTEQATHLLFNGNHTSPYWLYFGDGIARVTNFTEDKDIEGTALSSGTDWDTSLFNLFPVCNNTVDTPKYWDNDFAAPGTLTDLPAFPALTLCNVIRPFRSFLVAMNITVSGTGTEVTRVLWSDSSDAGALPASWDISDPTTLAGDAYLTSSRGEIIDGEQLRDFFVIYKTHSTFIMRLVGGQGVMRIDKVQVNSGLLTKNCVVEFKGSHFVVSDGDIVLFDGQNISSIANKLVRNKIFENIDQINYKNSYVVRNDRNKEIWFCYPTTGQTWSNLAAIWNWDDNTWAFRELVNTRHIATGVTNFAITPVKWSDANTKWRDYIGTWKSFTTNPTEDTLLLAVTLALNITSNVYDINGVAMASSLEKNSMTLGDGDIVIVKSVTPRITANAGTRIFIRIGTQNHPEDDISWSTEVLYTVGTDREAHFTEKGRYISIRFRTQDIATNWRLHGYSIEAAVSGRH